MSIDHSGGLGFLAQTLRGELHVSDSLDAKQRRIGFITWHSVATAKCVQDTLELSLEGTGTDVWNTICTYCQEQRISLSELPRS